MSTIDDTHLQDVGLCDDYFYRSSLSPLVYQIRSWLRPLIDSELPLLKYIQSFHNYWLTWYFLLTANVGSHTFYVLILPFPLWLGSLHLARDLVIVLGLGIYFTGFVKDLLCLPRPHSPPLKRLTMSHYTSKEYGCPSSHSANATSVCIFLFLHISHNHSMNVSVKPALYCALAVYWLSLICGRMYCGMHGLIDVTLGCAIGLFTVFVRLFTQPFWDKLCMTVTSSFTPILIISWYYFLIYIHPTPAEPCPCFEDSIAFIAVLLGLDLGFWSLSTDNKPLHILYNTHNSLNSYSWNQLGLFYTLLRIAVGILLVLIWRSIAKPLFTRIIRSWRSEDDSKFDNNCCFAYISRYDTRIIVKLIVYAGIPIVVLFSKFIFMYLNI